MTNTGKLIWEKNKHEFGDWADKIQPFFHTLEPVYEQLKFDTRRGLKVLPDCTDVFRVFKETPLKDLKAVVCGIAPYHTITKDYVIIADGLAMSCAHTNEEQPSLTQWYNAMEREFPAEPIYRNPNLSYLAKQGVMLFNMSLTVENMKVCSHNELWKPFVKAVFEEILNVTGVPVILLGKEAHPAQKWLAFQHCFPISHPASASYSQTDWDSEGVMKKVTRIVKDMNGEQLKWYDNETTGRTT